MTYKGTAEAHDRSPFALGNYSKTMAAEISRGVIARGNTPIVWYDGDDDHHRSQRQCETCFTPFTKSTKQADHCHDCGDYRGALCTDCNWIEGRLRSLGMVVIVPPTWKAYLITCSCYTDKSQRLRLF